MVMNHVKYDLLIKSNFFSLPGWFANTQISHLGKSGSIPASLSRYRR